MLVDSNVWLDVATEDPDWFEWSASRLAKAADREGVAMNAIVYAEVSVKYPTIEELDGFLAPLSVARLELPWEAGFVAGKVFDRYRKRGGDKRSPLPDFYIGAHAAVSGLTLLTRDPRRYREYFPRLRVIAPE
ncbi:MAG: type II toxin-antitoxin system VapC family toxin [Burkholderiales bacterium]